MKLVCLTLLLAVQTLPAFAKSPPRPRPPVTSENAPDILKRMVLTDAEFRGLLQGLVNSKERYEAGYCTGNLNGLNARGQTEGSPFFYGLWGVTGDGRKKPFAPDHEYRPGPTMIGKTYKRKPYPFMRNPLDGQVNTVLRYWPAEQPSPVKDNRPRKRIDLVIHGMINAASGDSIAESLAREEERAAEDIARSKSPNWKGSFHYRFARDLGFGLDRNSMKCGFGNSGVSGQIDIHLARARDFTEVGIYLKYEGQAIDEKRAVVLARNAAALVSNKVWGTTVKLERPVGGAGMVDAYTASALGKTPVEDRHEANLEIGKPFFVALVYRTEAPGARCFFNVRFKPSGDAIGKSERIMPHAKQAPNRKPLVDGTYARQYIELNGAGGLSDNTMCDTGFTPSVKPAGDDLRVVYLRVPTDIDFVSDLWKAPGAWEVQISMSEFRGEGEDHAEVSTEKLKINLVGTPAFYTANFTGLDPKTGEPK